VGLAKGAAGIGKAASAVPEKYRTMPPTLAVAANKARSEKAKAQHATSNPRKGEKSGRGTSSATTKRHKGRDADAASTGVNRGAVQRAGGMAL